MTLFSLGRGSSGRLTAACVLIVAGVSVAITAVGDVAAQPPANQQPEFPSSETGARSVAENTTAGIDIGAPVAATDAELDALTFSMAGVDADSFDFVTSSGQLLTKADLDYEALSAYSLTVSVSDSKDADGNSDTVIDDTIDVTVTVINSDEPWRGAGPTDRAAGPLRAPGAAQRPRRWSEVGLVAMGVVAERHRLDQYLGRDQMALQAEHGH